jgi:hypothetical protein
LLWTFLPLSLQRDSVPEVALAATVVNGNQAEARDDSVANASGPVPSAAVGLEDVSTFLKIHVVDAVTGEVVNRLQPLMPPLDGASASSTTLASGAVLLLEAPGSITLPSATRSIDDVCPKVSVGAPEVADVVIVDQHKHIAQIASLGRRPYEGRVATVKGIGRIPGQNPPCLHVGEAPAFAARADLRYVPPAVFVHGIRPVHLSVHSKVPEVLLVDELEGGLVGDTVGNRESYSRTRHDQGEHNHRRQSQSRDVYYIAGSPHFGPPKSW